MVKKERKYFFIPVEIKKRELPAKLFLAKHAVEEGFCVIIGNATYVQTLALHSVKGIYLGTSLLKSHGVLFDRLHKKGNKIIVCDEEGLVYYNKENFVKHHANIEIMKKVDSICAWGKHHKELLLHNNSLDNIVVTGNVRFDMYKEKYKYLFEEKRMEYREKYGKYILINTNLAAYNSYKGFHNFEEYLIDLINVSEVDARDKAFYYDKFNHQKNIYTQIVQLVNEILEKMPDINIIIRPHPGENLEFWNVFSDKRVTVIREGEVIPWILASELVIQQNCTTGIEASVLEKPTISFIPEYDERFDNGLPNQIACKCFTKNEVIEKIQTVLQSNMLNNKLIKGKDKLKDYIANINNDVWAEQLIIDQCNKNLVLCKRSINKYRAKFWQIGYDAFLKFCCNKSTRDYFKVKFDELSLQEIRKVFRNENISDIKIKNLCKNVYLMEKPNA